MNIDNLAEGKWIRDKLGQEYSGLDSSDRTIVRKLEQLPIKDVSALVEILRQRTSVKNPDDGNKYYSVENPMVDGVELPGIWRCVTIKGIVDPAVGPAGTIQQVLSYGWANSISWAEARSADSLEMQPLGATDYRFLTVIFPNIAIDKMYALAETLGNTGTFARPVVEGHTFTGTWFNSGVETGKSKDGSGIITLKLSIEYRDVEFHVTAQNSHSIVSTRQQLGITSQDAEPITPSAGQTRERIVEVNKDSSKNIKTLKDVGVAQTNTTTIVSKAGTTVIEEKTVQANALTPPETIQKGVIKRFVNKVSKYFSRYDTVEETITPADQKVVIDEASFAEHVKTTKNTESATDPTLIDNVTTYLSGIRGKIVKVFAERTQAGNVRKEVKEITPLNQTIEQGAIDRFVVGTKQTEKEVMYESPEAFLVMISDIVEKVRKFRTTLANKYVSLSDGEAGDIAIEETPAGNMKVGLSLDQVQDDKEESVTREVDAFSAKTTTVNTGATARVASSAPAFSPGTIQYLVDKWMKFKNRYQTTAIMDVATPQAFAPTQTSPARDYRVAERRDTYTSYIKKFYNAATLPDAHSKSWISGTTVFDTSLESPGINRYGLYDYTQTEKIYRVPSSASNVPWTTTGEYYWLPVGYKTDGRLDSVQKYQKRWTHTLTFHLTFAAASSAANNGVQGSTVYRLGDYLYCSHNIVRSDTAVGGLVYFPD